MCSSDLDHFHHISLLSLQFPMSHSSQCSMMPVITMLNGFCYHNAPGPVSSQYSIPLFITVHNERFITMLYNTCHHNAPEFLSSPCSMTVSSQCSMALVITMLQNSCHHNIPSPCHHNAPWPLSAQCSRILVITMFQDRKSTRLNSSH